MYLNNTNIICYIHIFLFNLYFILHLYFHLDTNLNRLKKLIKKNEILIKEKIKEQKNIYFWGIQNLDYKSTNYHSKSKMYIIAYYYDF